MLISPMWFANLFQSQKLLPPLFILMICGCGGGDAAPPTVPITANDRALFDITVSEVGPDSATLRFSTNQATTATVTLTAVDINTPAKTWNTNSATTHQVHIDNLWADVDWQLSIETNADEQNVQFKTTAPAWSSPCRTGDLRLPIHSESQWQIYTDSNGALTTETTTGCGGSGDAIKLSYNIENSNWVVASRVTPFAAPVDLSQYSHLWVPYRGTQDTALALELKLKDSDGDLGFVRLEGGSSLPVWRSWAIDLRQFRNQTGELDLSRISNLEIAVSSPLGEAGKRIGEIEMADLWAFQVADLQNDVTSAELIPHDTQSMALIAADLLARQQSHGFIPAWFELEANWHLYANAMALIVFTLEYERLAQSPELAEPYLLAAHRLAQALVRLQQLSDRNGAWDDSFNVVNEQLVLLPFSQRTLWVGSTAWAGIALLLAKDILPEGEVYEDSLLAVADFYQATQTCRENAGLPDGSITEGTEGNISSHLFWHALVARGMIQAQSADKLQRFIDEQLFDTQQQRFFCGVRVDIGDFQSSACRISGTGAVQFGNAQACLDVTGNWGSLWLKRQGRQQAAYAGLAFSKALFMTEGFNSPVKGLGDIAGPWSPTVEHGAGQWASVGGPDANFIMNQAKQYLCTAGQCRGASDNMSAGIGWNTQSYGISPAAWMYLAWHGGFWDKL